MRYQTYLEDPSLDAFRLDYSPRDGYGTVLASAWVVVTGESGTTYNMMRGLPLPETGTSVNFGAYAGTNVLDEAGSLAFSFRDHAVLERFRVEDLTDAVRYAGDSFQLDLRVDAFDWTDAGGQIELHGTPLGKACTFWIPAQGEFVHPVMSRSHLAKVTGKIGDDPVEGILNVDFYYSNPGITFRELGVTDKLHNYWMNWLVEYDDGELEGGFAWRGMPGTHFAASHHYVDGHSIARTDAKIDIERTERGTMERVTLGLGNDLTVTFDQHGSFDWPLHTYGTVSSISRDRKVARSWNYSENFPINWGAIEDYQYAHKALFGRFPSLHGLFKNARFEEGRVIPT